VHRKVKIKNRRRGLRVKIMNTALLSGLKKILKEYGTGSFDNIKFVGSALGGNTAAKAQPECDVLMLCLMADYHKELIGADETVRDSVKKSIAERLHGNEGIDADLCNNTLDILEAALFENEPVTEEKADESGTPQTSSVQENMELADKAAEIRELRTTVAEYKESLNRTKAGLIAAIVIGVTGLIISIAVGYGQYSSVSSLYYSTLYDWVQLQNDRDQLQIDKDQLQNDRDQLQIDKNQLQKDRDQLQIKYDALIKDFTALKAAWVSGVNITSIRAGNIAQGYQWLTKAGDALYASRMRYLAPVITYNSFLDIEITFYIKIIEPDGSLFRNPSISPTGYTYSTTAWVHRGNNQTLDLTGWGNSASSSYRAGQWTVEVWHNNACLRSEKVTINP
jgi:hypothetical protein